MFKKMATMAAALSLVAGSVAPAFAAQPLSLANSPEVRASASINGNALNGEDDTWIQIAAIAGVALLIAAFVLLLDDDVEPNQPFPPQPTSP